MGVPREVWRVYHPGHFDSSSEAIRKCDAEAEAGEGFNLRNPPGRSRSHVRYYGNGRILSGI